MEKNHKTKFLEQISPLTRYELNEILEKNCKRIKPICPIIRIKPPKENNGRGKRK